MAKLVVAKIPAEDGDGLIIQLKDIGSKIVLLPEEAIELCRRLPFVMPEHFKVKDFLVKDDGDDGSWDED